MSCYSKLIGNIGEAKVICKLVERSIPVYIPFGDNEKADIIAEFNGKLQKIQIKTSERDKNGVIEFNTSSNSRYVHYQYTSDDIDYLALYSIIRDKIYLLPVVDTCKTTISIRYKPPKKLYPLITYEDDVLIDTVLDMLLI